jgi:S-adenosylmethionine/arginine decarboxylase-like enzyme
MNKKSSSSRRFHFIIDAFKCDAALLSDKAFLVSLIKKIAKLIDMKIIKGPVAAKGIPVNPGYSVFAIIDFSHISIHTFTDPGEFCLDVFSCKPFDYKKLENYIKRVFKLKDNQIFKSVIKYGK